MIKIYKLIKEIFIMAVNKFFVKLSNESILVMPDPSGYQLVE